MRSQRRLINICCLVLVAPALCWAIQDESHARQAVPQAGEAHAASDAPSERGEQDKPTLLTFDPGAAIWSIIVFMVLLIVLRAAAWKPILRVLKDREEFIQKSIDDARQEREQAEQLLADYQARLDQARAEASVIVEEGRRGAEVVHQRILEEAREESAEMTARARREIQLATDTAIKELYDRTAELSIDVAARLMRKELSAEDHTRLVAKSIAEIRANGKAKLN